MFFWRLLLGCMLQEVDTEWPVIKDWPFFMVRQGMARGAQAPSDQLWWLVGDLGVEDPYGP